MTFERTMVGETLLLTPTKNLVGGDETTSLTAAIDQTAKAGAAKVVLDLGKISWVSSLGLSALRRVRRTCLNSSGWLRLARVDQRIKNTLVIVGLARDFDTFDTVEQALAAQD